jgi:hypothetical protein
MVLGVAIAVLGGLPLPARQGRDAADVAIEVTPGEQIVFRAGKELVTRYHIATDAAKPYFWPLYASGGVAVTRGWPMEKAGPGEEPDHIHQKSAWFCHGDVIPEGVELKQKVKGVEGVDFWSETPGHGRIVCVNVEEPRVEKNHGKVRTHNEWRTADGVKILDEMRTIHLYDFIAGRLLVLDIDLHADVCPITFGDTKEGSLGVRVRTSMTEEKGEGHITNAENHAGEGRLNNIDKKGCWGLLSAWCDYAGPAGDADVTAGVAVFDDPTNPHPAAWHSRGYGLMAANPFGRAKSGFPSQKGRTDLVRLAKGDHLKLRYGIFVHRGNVKEGKVAEYYDRFVKLK